jgi:PIN domain nuclease of toxin-antitoxin system
VILLDTHVLLWMRLAPERLSARARVAIAEARAAGGLAIAAFSLYELARIRARGDVQAPAGLESALAELVAPVTVVPLSPTIAALAGAVPRSIPGDPGDRLITATARAHGASLVTADRALQESPVIETIW